MFLSLKKSKAVISTLVTGPFISRSFASCASLWVLCSGCTNQRQYVLHCNPSCSVALRTEQLHSFAFTWTYQLFCYLRYYARIWEASNNYRSKQNTLLGKVS